MLNVDLYCNYLNQIETKAKVATFIYSYDH
jgi:hypothetical protein